MYDSLLEIGYDIQAIRLYLLAVGQTFESIVLASAKRTVEYIDIYDLAVEPITDLE